MLPPLPSPARIRSLLELRLAVERAIEELALARHELVDIERRVRLARLHVNSADDAVEAITGVYNRAAAECPAAAVPRRARGEGRPSR